MSGSAPMSLGTPAARNTPASRTLRIVAAIAVDARGLSIVHLHLARHASATDVAGTRRPLLSHPLQHRGDEEAVKQCTVAARGAYALVRIFGNRYGTRCGRRHQPRTVGSRSRYGATGGAAGTSEAPGCST